MIEQYFLEILCACYLVGGITIGYYFKSWRDRKENSKTGTGRWDYKDRHLGDGKFK
jgi:hypothetical protein